MPPPYSHLSLLNGTSSLLLIISSPPASCLPCFTYSFFLSTSVSVPPYIHFTLLYSFSSSFSHCSFFLSSLFSCPSSRMFPLFPYSCFHLHFLSHFLHTLHSRLYPPPPYTPHPLLPPFPPFIPPPPFLFPPLRLLLPLLHRVEGWKGRVPGARASEGPVTRYHDPVMSCPRRPCRREH